jgi:hypothetical protein
MRVRLNPSREKWTSGVVQRVLTFYPTLGKTNPHNPHNHNFRDATAQRQR